MNRLARLLLYACAFSMALPSATLSQAPECPEGSSTGTLAGTVWDESRTLGLPGVRVEVRWAGGSAEGESGADGRYIVCGLAPDEPLAAVARFSGFSSVAHEFSAGAGEQVTHDFLISMSAATETGESGRVLGSVIDADTEAPIEAAIVGLAGRGYETITDGTGSFVLDNVPAGAQDLELRHLAYGTQRASVDVRAGSSVSVLVRLAAQPIEVEPIRVTVTGVRDLGLEMRGFYERREWNEKLGQGHYFTWEDIERRNPQLISHMIADVPGTRLECSGSRNCVLSFVGIPRTIGCQRADVYIDGVNVIRSDAGSSHWLWELVRPFEIAGVEVYSGPAAMPAEFSGASGSCGAIVIWTK